MSESEATGDGGCYRATPSSQIEPVPPMRCHREHRCVAGNAGESIYHPVVSIGCRNPKNSGTCGRIIWHDIPSVTSSMG